MSEARLRLALGAAAVLGDPLPALGPHRRFAARGPGDPPGSVTRLVVVHPAGVTTTGAMVERMAAIRAARHEGLMAPLATGEVDGEVWIVEPIPIAPTIAERLEGGAAMPTQEVVQVLRGVARALSALHRAGLAHGGITAESVSWAAGKTSLGHLGHAPTGSPVGDLHHLGLLGKRMLAAREPTHERPTGSGRRRVPAELETMLARLSDPDGRQRLSAEQVLEGLDWFPDRQRSPLRSLLDGAGRGARLPGERRIGLLLAAGGVLLFVLWVLFGRG
jgi:hypothetical protein